MKITFQHAGASFSADLSKPIDISIPMIFGGPQPNAYGVDPAVARACEYGDLVGDTRRGGSCNFEQVTLIPHCNGTHTECVGHITDERFSVRDCLREALFPAALVSVSPVDLSGSGESYPSEARDDDLVITAEAIREALRDAGMENASVSALVVRTLPNPLDKLSRLYREYIPPYFTSEAIAALEDLNIDHLICDLPSIDRLHDGGNLANHRLFWKIPSGSNRADSETNIHKTITELAYVSDEVPDGLYLLNLQIAPFESDAAPSRPVVFPARLILNPEQYRGNQSPER
jgi:kynurenine formamidase